MAEKQANFDANYEKIIEHIGSFRMKTVLANDERKVAALIMDDFYKNCVNSLDGKNYDLSSNSKTIEIMNYITNCYDQVVYETKNTYKANNNTTTNNKSTVSNNPSIINGGYVTNQILEYQYNSKTNKYDLVFDEKISSKLFLHLHKYISKEVIMIGCFLNGLIKDSMKIRNNISFLINTIKPSLLIKTLIQ